MAIVIATGERAARILELEQENVNLRTCASNLERDNAQLQAGLGHETHRANENGKRANALNEQARADAKIADNEKQRADAAARDSLKVAQALITQTERADRLQAELDATKDLLVQEQLENAELLDKIVDIGAAVNDKLGAIGGGIQ